jgi:hypothetical protein
MYRRSDVFEGTGQNGAEVLVEKTGARVGCAGCAGGCGGGAGG